MCIRTVTTDEVANHVEYNISDNDMIPDHVKTKITKAIDKYTKHHDNIKNIKNPIEKNEEHHHHEITEDIVAQFAQQFKILLRVMMKYWEICQHSNIYKVLFKTTQPAHIIAIIAVLGTLSAIVPRSHVEINNTNESHSKLLTFIYLTSFILHVGSQFWMTFVSGLSLYFALPRHNFGQVQRVLFPRYFTINACLSLTTLMIFLKYHSFHTWDTEIAIQISAMFAAFFLELFIRLYLTPPLIGLMTAKAAIEEAAGIGNEIGHQSLGPLANCPHYVKMNRAFRKIHMNVAIGNIVTMVCTVSHLHYIAGKICM